MPVLITPEMPYSQERAKWEAQGGPWGSGEKPCVFKEYPMAMYKITERNPIQQEFMLADDETGRRNLESRGFVAGGPAKALEVYDAEQRQLAQAAAERNYADRRMSPEAQAEAARYEAETDGHVAVIPEIPVKRGPGRPPKVQE